MDLSTGFTAEELRRRRVASRRLAWLLGGVAVAIYVLGFIVYRS
ncbi:MAG: hypothetical protein V5B36_03605 [Candidatus Accumulibacter sp. UW25]|jgi:hypothetical protein